MANATHYPIGAEAYIDHQDPSNPGWAYRIRYSDEHTESGELDAQDDRDARSDLYELLVQAGADAVGIRMDARGALVWSAS